MDPVNAAVSTIIGGLVQVLPLILIPILLKGMMDSIPVLGRLAQTAMKNSQNLANKHIRDSGFYAARRAEMQSGQRNLLGQRRSESAINDPNNSTALEYLRGRRRVNESRIKNADTLGDIRHKERMAGVEDTNAALPTMAQRQAQAARRAHNVAEVNEGREKRVGAQLTSQGDAERKDLNTSLGQLEFQRRGYGSKSAKYNAQLEDNWDAAQTKPSDENLKNPEFNAQNQAFNTQLKDIGLDRDTLIRDAHETSAYTRSRAFSADQRSKDYADILGRTLEGGGLETDKTLLKIAGGNVSPTAGAKRAQAVAVETSRNIANQSTAAAQSVAKRLMDERQLQILEATNAERLNDFDEPLDANGNVIKAPNTILEEMLQSSDVHEVLAARNEFMSQGQSGVMSGLRSIEELEEKGAGEKGTFKGREEILTQLKRTMLSEHGKALKENATYAVAWANGSGTLRDAKQNQDRYTALTNDQLADQSTASILTGIANGAIDAHRAEEILTDDKLKSKYDQEQTSIFQMLKDHGADAVTATWNPDDGKLWAKEKDTSLKKKPTYAEWVEKTMNAQQKRRATAPDSNAVPTDTVEGSDDIEDILPGSAPAPRPGSPTPVLKQYADKAGGVNRMSRETFTAFQNSVANAPDRNPDNQDLEALISQVDSEVSRRNNEARKINQTATTNITGGTYDSSRDPIKLSAEYSPLNMPPMSPSADEGDQPQPQAQAQPQPQQQSSPADYRRNVPAEEIRQNFEQAAQEFGYTGNIREGMGIGSTDWNSLDQGAKDRVNEVLRVYRGARRNAVDGPSGGDQVVAGLRESLPQDIRRAIDNEGWSDR